MNSRILSINRGVVDMRKMLWFIIIFEVLVMSFALLGDMYANAYFWGIVLIPVLLILIPIEPVIGIPLMFIATGFDFAGQITKTEGSELNLTYFHIVMVLTFISVFLNNFFNRKTTFPSCSLWGPVLCFLTLIAVSLLYTPNFFSGFMQLLRLSVLCALAFAMIICVNTKLKFKFVMWSYILIPLGVAIFTIYEILTEGAFFASQIARVATALGINVFRSTGTFHNPNDLACFLMIGITGSFGLFFVKKQSILLRIFLVVCMGVISIGVVASYSRGGWLSAFAAIFVLILLHKRWSYFGIFLGLLTIMLVIISIQFPHLVLSALDRFATILNPMSEDSSSSRLSLIKTGIWIWQDHPIFGVGIRGFPHYVFDYMDPNMPLMLSSVKQAHTLQVKILSELGLIGFTVATWFFFTVLFKGIRSIKTIKDDFLKNTQIILTSLFVGYIVNFTFASDIVNNTFWITVGLIYAVPLVYKKSLDDEKPQSGDTPLPLNDSSS